MAEPSRGAPMGGGSRPPTSEGAGPTAGGGATGAASSQGGSTTGAGNAVTGASDTEQVDEDRTLVGGEEVASGNVDVMVDAAPLAPSPRARTSINEGWRFTAGDPAGTTGLGYEQAQAWVLPTANEFLVDAANLPQRPAANLGGNVPYVSVGFDDSNWQSVTLPHDYAIEGPYTNDISSSMGRLSSTGVAWYRREVAVPEAEAGKSFFLDLDGAMSFSMVWVNGQFAGGWPNGYASYRLDVTELVAPGQANTIAIRVDNPTPETANWQNGSSRWYPGAGIYRNVWWVSTDPVHVGHWGTQITTPEVSVESAQVQLTVQVDNRSQEQKDVTVFTELYELNADGVRVGNVVARLTDTELSLGPGASSAVQTGGTVVAPKLWGPPPGQQPHRYVALTSIVRDGQLLDRFETPFGIRTLEYSGEQGLLVNGQRVQLQGVCIHHDLGPLGAAFNYRARERQLQLLAEMGTNAIRTAHNPFEPEFYELADRLGMVVVNEAFDVWESPKANFDYNRLFTDWHEQDLRALIRRDRNHPSVILWSIGNEVGEQNSPTRGPELGQLLTAISHEEDPTRLTTAGMNAAEPDNPFSVPIDTIGLNYQGTGVRDRGAQYPTYHEQFPDKFVYGSETVSTFSTRGTFLFPVAPGPAEPAVGSTGIDTANGLVSSYGLYHADWSSSPDEEFASQERWPYVAGEFVWTGFDYLGEPTPLDAVASSSYFGIFDLAGLKKDRFYLYQSVWRPELPMAHILPHWSWPQRVGQVTPIHVYTSGDSAELFVNGVSQGLKSKAPLSYRLRWDEVVYQPGEVSVVAYRDGVQWATDEVQTVGAATQLSLSADRAAIAADGEDLSFVTIRVLDAQGRLVPQAAQSVAVQVSGSGELVATSNGDPTNRTVFSSEQRDAFSGQLVAVVRALSGQSGDLVVRAAAQGLIAGQQTIVTAE